MKKTKKFKREKLPEFPDMTDPNVQQDLVSIMMHYVQKAERFVQLVGFSVDVDQDADIYSVSISVRPKKFTIGGGGTRKHKPPKPPKGLAVGVVQGRSRQGVNVN